MSHQLINNVKALFVAAGCALLVACGGGGGGGSSGSDDGGSEPVTQTPSVGFTLSGTWRAMSMGGFYPVQIDEVAGTLSYAMPDEITGVQRSVSMAGMSRGFDGAYVFRSGLSAGGMALDAKFYRVDDTTMAGAILSSLNGAMKLTPVILTKNWATNTARLAGDWSQSWFGCDYNHETQQCGLGGFQSNSYRGYRSAVRFDGLNVMWCDMFPVDVRVADCQSDKLMSYAQSDFGDGVIGDDTDRAMMFTVAGDDVIAMHSHDATDDYTYVRNRFYTRDTKFTSTAFNGTWRVVTEEGRTGVANIDGESFVVDVEGRAQVVGKLRRNTPWNGIARLDVDGMRDPYYMAGTRRMAYVASSNGLYLLHRDTTADAAFVASAPKSSLSGTWRAMSAGGIQEAAIDETVGTIHYNMIDVVTGSTTSATLAQLRRGSDGAYIFSLEESPNVFSEGGQLYRLDDDTLVGKMPARMNGKVTLMPVVISRNLITDSASLEGNWSYSYFECGYDLAADHCGDGGADQYNGGRGAIAVRQMVQTECADIDTPIWACADNQVQTTAVNALGNGIYGLGQTQVQGFIVRGVPLMFGHSRRTEGNQVMISSRLYAKRTEVAAADWSGTWRVEAVDGREGIALIEHISFLFIQLGGVEKSSRMRTPNKPWDGLAVVGIDSAVSSPVNYMVGSRDLLFVGGDEGFYFFHRAQ